MHILSLNQIAVYFCSELIRQCTASMEDLMQSAFTEVNLFSDEHAWIATIHSFVITWNQGVLMSWKGQSASKIEVRCIILNKISFIIWALKSLQKLHAGFVESHSYVHLESFQFPSYVVRVLICHSETSEANKKMD